MNEVVRRIISVVDKNFLKEERSRIWEECINQSLSTEINAGTLENMSNSSLIHGFFGGTPSRDTHYSLIRLAEALGVVGIENPGDDGVKLYPAKSISNLSNDDILDIIQLTLPFQINLPPFLGGDVGVPTKYGNLTDRHCYYLWVMKRIIELCPDKNSSIIEIGAGLGLLGYYLDRAGYKDYTIIDLARVNACQAYFLARNLPEREIILSKEKKHPFSYKYKECFKVLHTSDFYSIPKNRYDIMINMDGIVEMNTEQAMEYLYNECSPLFLSINHEVGDFRVIEVHSAFKKLKYRYPFWPREGYMEELYINKPL